MTDREPPAVEDVEHMSLDELCDELRRIAEAGQTARRIERVCELVGEVIDRRMALDGLDGDSI